VGERSLDMTTRRKLVLKKERIRVLGTESLRAAVGGDDYEPDFGPYDDGAGNMPDVLPSWMRWGDDTVWNGRGNWDDTMYFGRDYSGTFWDI